MLLELWDCFWKQYRADAVPVSFHLFVYVRNG
jgi:hypothetical protein